MKNKLRDILFSVIGQHVSEVHSVGGGCISSAWHVTMEDGLHLFCKTGTAPESYAKEAHGLETIASTNTIKTPKVIYFSKEILVLEYVQQGIKKQGFFTEFGKAFARMHLCINKEYGFYEDNLIGSSLQSNIAKGDERNNWPLFYFNQRLLPQFKMAIRNGYDDKNLRRLMLGLENKIDGLLTHTDPKPCLLHGDLWSGNFMVSNESLPVLIDPAVYYGHREADLAMTRLFGGFPQEFYEAYHQTYPLIDGWEYRQGIYQLYHMLNHLNMFGTSYYSQVINLLKQYVN